MSTRHGSATVELPTDTEIVITRSFEAPRDLVWAAITTPAHVRNWYGFASNPLVVCEIDLRVGGTWRYVTHTDDGIELAWSGTYIELDAPDRIVSTETFEPFPDAWSTNTVTLTEVDGVTTLRTVVVHQSRENRDGHVGSGMEGGMQQSYNRLDTLLHTFDAGTPAARFRRVATDFSERLAAVPADRWESPTPCDGWVVRDVVRHLVEWVPGLFGSASDLEITVSADVDDDPVRAWEQLRAALQTALDDPDMSAGAFSHPQAGDHRLDDAIAMFVLGDVLIHTWDVARATGLDERLDPAEVHAMHDGLSAMGDVLASSGQYAAIVTPPDGADEQTRLLGLTGRDV